MSDSPSGNDEKLKNLAESLSEELGGAKGPGSSGAAPTNVQANSETPQAAPPPNPAPAPATDDEEVSLDFMMAQTSSPPSAAPESRVEVKEEAKSEVKPEVEVLSIEDLDKILNETDPVFLENMNALSKDLSVHSKKIDLKSLKLDREILGITDKEEREAKAKRLSLATRTVNAIISGTNIGIDRMTDFTYNSAIVIRDQSKKISPLVRKVFDYLRNEVLEFLKWYKSRTKIQKINLFLLVSASLALTIVVTRLIQGKSLLRPAEFPLLRSFEEVATRIETLKLDEPMEQFDSPLRNPEYVVLYSKMFVNLKAKGSSRNPMAAFEIFIEANSQESAIELKDRERQFKDVIARVFESIPYDEVVTADGKAKLKLIIRRDINQVLNKGRVKKVYFKTFFYKQ